MPLVAAKLPRKGTTGTSSILIEQGQDSHLTLQLGVAAGLPERQTHAVPKQSSTIAHLAAAKLSGKDTTGMFSILIEQEGQVSHLTLQFGVAAGPPGRQTHAVLQVLARHDVMK